MCKPWGSCRGFQVNGFLPGNEAGVLSAGVQDPAEEFDMLLIMVRKVHAFARFVKKHRWLHNLK